jgi:hypothetical protein
MDLKEIGWMGVDRIFLAGDRDQWQAVNSVMKLVSSNRQETS